MELQSPYFTGHGTCLYYITKPRKGAKGEGLIFYSPEEAEIAYNERKVELHSWIKVKTKDLDSEGKLVDMIIETTVGRILFNKCCTTRSRLYQRIIIKKIIT